MTPELLKHFSQFDRFFVMEPYMADKLVSFGIDKRKVVCLNIEDIYKRHDHELVRILENSLNTEISWALKNP
jgi:predicted protein tyrosine phosphatase